ncbi:MAG: 4-hydroxythreonine-4-phosphate dehydrogenase PdxA [Coleofasciculaceae cyanobacterium SM2_1_6]|nr:4-hydroxythreonine-4-phosphate dehydrogenase PdxA [Coleofasciculaceae cyanobacterium SM2_1_6]
MEVVLKALATVNPAYQITLVGTKSLLTQAYENLSKNLSENLSKNLSENLSENLSLASTAHPATYPKLAYPKLAYPKLANPDRLRIIDVPLGSEVLREITPGVGNAASGWASFAYLERAIEATLSGEFQAIVTAPIAKSAWKLAGHNYPGQTEVLAKVAGVERYGMLFVARSPHTGWMLRTLLATTHIPLAAVPQALTPRLLDQKLELLIECLREDFGITQPRIAIAGLNPHSGEAGQIGTEEQDWLIPWLKAQQAKYPQATLDGLIPPDTLWVKPGQAWYGNLPPEDHLENSLADNSAYKLIDNPVPKTPQAHDAYLALYHDQGLIPVKLMAFDRAINTTIGLPFVRTSPDHGTAFDIAGQGLADPRSMGAAIDLAAELAIIKMASR